MDEILAVVGIGLCICIFLIIIVSIGSFYGGSWDLVAQGVTKFILLIVAFSIGAFVLMKNMEGR